MSGELKGYTLAITVLHSGPVTFWEGEGCILNLDYTFQYCWLMLIDHLLPVSFLITYLMWRIGIYFSAHFIGEEIETQIR